MELELEGQIETKAGWQRLHSAEPEDVPLWEGVATATIQLLRTSIVNLPAATLPRRQSQFAVKVLAHKLTSFYEGDKDFMAPLTLPVLRSVCRPTLLLECPHHQSPTM